MEASQVDNYMDKFNLKVLEAEHKISKVKEDGSGGNPMWEVTLEFFNNKPMKVKNHETGEFEEVNPDGLQVKTWVTLTPKAIGSVNSFRKFIGLPPTTEAALQQEDGNTYKGLVGEAIVAFKARPFKNSGGEVITDSEGKPVTTSERNIVKLLPKAA